MEKVLMIVQNNFVNDSRIIKEANTLGKNGYEVKVLSLHDKDLKEKEKFEFFEVERIHLSTRNKLSKKIVYIQFIKYLEFYMNCIKRAKKFRPDIVHCHDLATLPIGKRIRNLCNCKLVYDSHELWSHSSGIEKYSKFFLKVRNDLEKKIALKSDAIITVSNSIANKLVDQFGLEKKPIIIRNIPLRKEIKEEQDLFRKKFNIKSDEKIILYQGGIEKGRGIEKIIQIIPLIESNIVLVLLGNGTLIPKLKELTEKLKIQNRVFFHEAINQDILLNYTNSADVGLSLIENCCLSYYYSLPNKMFEFIQANLPIICSDFPEMRNIVKGFEIGEVANPEDKLKIAQAINDIVLNQDKFNYYKKNCQKAKKVLNWENEEKLLLKLYTNLFE